MDGLARVMASQGYDGASVQEIAAAAGLGAGLVHHHFGSKEEILLELAEVLGREHLARVDEALEDAPDPAGALDRAVDLHLALEGGDRTRLACWLALTTEALRRPPVGDRVAATLRGLAERFEAILAALDPAAAGTAPARAAAIVAAIEGYLVVAAVAPALVPRGSAAPALRRVARALARGDA